MSFFSKNYLCSQSTRMVGDPVDVVTGANIDSNCDFQLEGPLPFEWRRNYNSNNKRILYSLGWGHSHEYERSLQFDIDGIRYTDQKGSITTFPVLMGDDNRALKNGLILDRISENRYLLKEHTKPTMEFVFMENEFHTYLKRLFDTVNSIEFRYNSLGFLETITDSLGRHIRIDTDNQGKILSLVLIKVLNKDQKEEKTLIIYKYDDFGNLIEGVDFHGNSFGFSYDTSNRMTSKTDRKGYTFQYKYNNKGLCIHSYGEDGLHEVKLEYMPLERTTIVTNACGGDWTYLYNESGTVTQIIDPYGGVKLYEVNPSDCTK